MHKHLGVRYIYEDIKENQSLNTSDDMENALTPTAIAALPQELLTHLEEAAIRSKMNEVESLIEKVRELNAPLAEALAMLADGFEYPKIVTLIQQSQATQL